MCRQRTTVLVACRQLTCTAACVLLQVMTRLQAKGFDPYMALCAVQNSIGGLLPSFCMSSGKDIDGHILMACSEDPTYRLFLFDTHAGGVGLADCAFARCVCGCPNPLRTLPHREELLYIRPDGVLLERLIIHGCPDALSDSRAVWRSCCARR